MTTSYDFSRAIVRKMIEEFGKMPEEEKLAWVINTILKDIGFEVMLPQYLKEHPTIFNYYEAKKGNIPIDPKVKEFCLTTCKELLPEWPKMYYRIKKEMIESGEAKKYEPRRERSDVIFVGGGSFGRSYK